MDYKKLAEEFFRYNYLMSRTRPQRTLNESVRGEIFVLNLIARNDGDVLPSEISKESRLSTARIAAALNSLENKELITRQIDPKDRRRILVRLTEQGENLIRENQENGINEVAQMLRNLGEKDATEYIRIMGRIAENAALLDDGGTAPPDTQPGDT